MPSVLPPATGSNTIGTRDSAARIAPMAARASGCQAACAWPMSPLGQGGLGSFIRSRPPSPGWLPKVRANQAQFSTKLARSSVSVQNAGASMPSNEPTTTRRMPRAAARSSSRRSASTSLSARPNCLQSRQRRKGKKTRASLAPSRAMASRRATSRSTPPSTKPLSAPPRKSSACVTPGRAVALPVMAIGASAAAVPQCSRRRRFSDLMQRGGRSAHAPQARSRSASGTKTYRTC